MTVNDWQQVIFASSMKQTKHVTRVSVYDRSVLTFLRNQLRLCFQLPYSAAVDNRGNLFNNEVIIHSLSCCYCVKSLLCYLLSTALDLHPMLILYITYLCVSVVILLTTIM